jgi:hypothetical protein
LEVKMSNVFPTNTVLWIVITVVAVTTSAGLVFSQTIKKLSFSPAVARTWRWGILVFLAGSLLIRLGLAFEPPAWKSIRDLFTFSFVYTGLVLLAGLIPLLVSTQFRHILRAIPATWLVGVHGIRVAGFLFLALADMRLLPAGFALPAGYGDMLTGLFAIGLVALLRQGKPHTRALVVAWNLFGLLDFVSAFVTGKLFLGQFAAQAAAAGSSLGYLNYVLLIPSFAVPVFALLHFFSLYQVYLLRKSQTETAKMTPAPQSSIQ